MENLASYFDHTYLKADAMNADIERVCQEAKENHFKSVCIPPSYVAKAKALLQESQVLVCTVIGFPLGYQTTKTKLYETKEALANGADEIDMVLAIGRFKNHENDGVQEEINLLAKTCHQNQAILKVILETALLTKQEIQQACQLAKQAEADFVKTSTGFSTAGASIEDVKLMKQIVGNQLGIKASGGIRTLSDALAMIEAGASRIGASSSVDIIKVYHETQ